MNTFNKYTFEKRKKKKNENFDNKVMGERKPPIL